MSVFGAAAPKAKDINALETKTGPSTMGNDFLEHMLSMAGLLTKTFRNGSI
jgi:hypothetical protein